MRLTYAVFLPMILLALSGTAQAGEELNIYSARHYQTDERLYATFERQTGIRINRLEGEGDALVARIRQEGAYSPADILITVDAGRLWRAEEAGLFQPVSSVLLEARIPANLRHPEGEWFGFSTRARMIFVNPDLVDPSQVQSYRDLADPRLKGQICIRSSSNIYNLSLMGAMIAHLGEEGALDWAKGVVANFARKPQGGDTDQIRAAAAGRCGVAVANSYYFARLMASEDPEDRAAVAALVPVFPDQQGVGTHVNVSGAGVLKHAPNREAAVRFLEYLASDEAQRWFAEGNHEYPAVRGVAHDEALSRLGTFRADDLNVATLGENQPLAQRLMDLANWP